MPLNAEGDSSKGKTQLSVRVDDELKEAFKKATDAAGETMTDAVDELLREYVAEHGYAAGDGGDPLPEEPMLRKGYRALRQKCPPDHYRLGTDVAESAVAESTRVNVAGVRRQVLDPLEERGYIRYRWGTVQVVPLERVKEGWIDDLAVRRRHDPGPCRPGARGRIPATPRGVRRRNERRSPALRPERIFVR